MKLNKCNIIAISIIITLGIILPALLHPLGITDLFSEADLMLHIIGILIGVIIGLFYCRNR